MFKKVSEGTPWYMEIGIVVGVGIGCLFALKYAAKKMSPGSLAKGVLSSII